MPVELVELFAVSIRTGFLGSPHAAVTVYREVAPFNAAMKEGVRVGGGAECLIHPGGHREPAPAAAIAVLELQHAGRRVEAGAAEQGGVDIVSLHVMFSLMCQACVHCKEKQAF